MACCFCSYCLPSWLWALALNSIENLLGRAGTDLLTLLQTDACRRKPWRVSPILPSSISSSGLAPGLVPLKARTPSSVFYLGLNAPHHCWNAVTSPLCMPNLSRPTNSRLLNSKLFVFNRKGGSQAPERDLEQTPSEKRWWVEVFPFD